MESSIITFTNIKKHFSTTNILVGILSLLITYLLKISPLPVFILSIFDITPTIIHEYIIIGFISLTIRLGIKGIVEEMNISDLINKFCFNNPLKMKIDNMLNPEVANQEATPILPNQQAKDRANFGWKLHNFHGDGFNVINGRIIVNNPGNILSFYGSDGIPDKSIEAKTFAMNIEKALNHHGDFSLYITRALPPMDSTSKS
jgi:hypothetical protein